MTRHHSETTSNAAASSLPDHKGAESKPRALFIDQLRAALIALVIAHHASICYNVFNDTVPLNLNTAGVALSTALMWFIAVNQAFFMGMFFMISGYFVPRSVARKGSGAFLRDRLLRLGIPLFVYWLVLAPVFYALADATTLRQPYFERLAANYSSNFHLQSGPLWFLIVLMAFSVGYVLWVRLFGMPETADPERPIPPSSAWVKAAVGVGVASFAVWLSYQWFPLSAEAARTLDIIGLGYLVFGIPYLPAYVFLFAVGCVAARYRWLERVEGPQARAWGWIALIVMIFYAAAIAYTLIVVGPGTETGGLMLTIFLGLKQFSDQLLAFGAIAWLLWWFRTHESLGGTFLANAGANAFGAFILHQPILIVLEVLTKEWPLPVFVTFIVVTTAAIGLSFGATALLRRSAAVRRIL
jgi:fucose 4-O-acetylase-like acetyltransferase